MLKLFKKDLKLFIKDKRSVVLTFLLPIILITFFAFAFGGAGGNSGGSDPIELLTVDLDKSRASKAMIAQLDSVNGLDVVASKLDEAKKLVKEGKSVGVLIFHKGFQDSVIGFKKMPVEFMYDKAREAELGLLQPVLMNTLMSPTGYVPGPKEIDDFMNRSFPSSYDKLVIDTVRRALENRGQVTAIKPESPVKFTSIVGEENETNIGLVHAVAGTAIMMLLFSVAGLGTSILEEKENGTIHRLLYSPINGSVILYGKMLFAFFIATLQLTVMFLFAMVAFNLDLTTNIPALILMILATAFAVSSFGIFLAAVSKTRQQAQSLSTLIILVMSAVGGSMIPLFVMPAIMQKMAIFSVNYWGIQGFYDIFWRQLSIVDILPRVGVLLAIGVVMTLISIRMFKKSILKLV